MKEARAFRVAELMGDRIIAHDDRLLLRAQKSDIGLTKEWRQEVDIRHRDGEVEIVSYVLPSEDGEIARVVKPETFDTLTDEEKGKYKPQLLRGLDLAEGVTVTFRDNRMDLIMADLFEDAASRYRKGLEYLLDLADRGVIAYTPRAEDNPRNRREAVRNRMKRYVKPTEYEHDILFRGEVGRALGLDLAAHDIADEHYEGTTYLQGFRKYDGLRKSVKYYDVGHREGSGDGEYFKLETTIRKDYFKGEGLGVADLTEQPNIQERIYAELVESVARALNLCTDRTMDMIAEALNVPRGTRRQAPRILAEAMLVRERTYTERLEALERKVEQHDRDIEQHDRDIEQLKRATGLR